MSADLTALTNYVGQLQSWSQTVETRLKSTADELADVKKRLGEMEAKAAAKAAAAAKRGTGAKRGGGEEKFPGTLATYFKKFELPKIDQLPMTIQKIYAAKCQEHKGIADETKRNKEIQASTWKLITEVNKNKEKDDDHREVGRYHATIDAAFKAGKKAWEDAHPKQAEAVPAGMPPALNLASPMPNIGALSLSMPAMPTMPTMPGMFPPGVAPAAPAPVAPAPVAAMPAFPFNK
jgi:hypothetical protein